MRIHLGISGFHSGGGGLGLCNVHQLALVHAGAVLGGLCPGSFAFQQFGPVRKRAALGWFGGMHGAAVIKVELALAAIRRFAQAELGAGADATLAFEIGGALVEVGREFVQVGFGEENLAFHLTAKGAVGQAGEA